MSILNWMIDSTLPNTSSIYSSTYCIRRLKAVHFSFQLFFFWLLIIDTLLLLLSTFFPSRALPFNTILYEITSQLTKPWKWNKNCGACCWRRIELADKNDKLELYKYHIIENLLLFNFCIYIHRNTIVSLTDEMKYCNLPSSHKAAADAWCNSCWFLPLSP